MQEAVGRTQANPGTVAGAVPATASVVDVADESTGAADNEASCATVPINGVDMDASIGTPSTHFSDCSCAVDGSGADQVPGWGVFTNKVRWVVRSHSHARKVARLLFFSAYGPPAFPTPPPPGANAAG